MDEVTIPVEELAVVEGEATVEEVVVNDEGGFVGGTANPGMAGISTSSTTSRQSYPEGKLSQLK